MLCRRRLWWSKETVAVVTGANKGIGYAIVKRLAELGLTVILTARNAERGEIAVGNLRRSGLLHVHFCCLDVSCQKSIQGFVSWLRQNFDGLDILVNNAAVSFNNIDENSVVHAETVIRTNYYGAKMLTESLLPFFRRSSDISRILNVTSRLGALDKVKNLKIRSVLEHENLSEEQISDTVNLFLKSVEDGTWETQGWPEVWTDYAVSKTGMTGGVGKRTAEDAAKIAAAILLLPPQSVTTGKFYTGVDYPSVKCGAENIMDKKKNALFRAKLEERKKNQVKRIDHPLLRYNEKDQPICKVCDLVLKSGLHWDAHQVSAKHHQAVKNLKANAARVAQVDNAKPKHQTEPQEPKTDPTNSFHPHVAEAKKSGILEQRPSHTLPENFFDNSKDTKRQKTGNTSASVAKVSSQNSMGPPAESIPSQPEAPEIENTTATPSVGALPAGFFDNKDADLRARGIEPVKPNVNDEYKEFEKLIQDDLQEVDNRLEEEEIDAAEMIEIAETLEQQAYREKVERLKKLKMKVEEAKSSTIKKDGPASRNDTVDEESSSDSDEDYDDSTVDWRAQHL
ncbi:unnamed protein product [Rhodiola kirilowii]